MNGWLDGQTKPFNLLNNWLKDKQQHKQKPTDRLLERLAPGVSKQLEYVDNGQKRLCIGASESVAGL